MSRRLLFAALFCFFVSAPVWAQSSVYLSSSSGFVNFETGSTPGTLNVYLGWEAGDNYNSNQTTNLTMTGSVTGPSSWGTLPGYTLTTTDPIALTNSGNGTFTASASGLTGSSFSAAGNSGSTLFSGSLSALSFTQAANSDVVSMDATVDGSGAYANDTLSLLGDITLANGATLDGVANSNTFVNEGGVIVPEPGTMWLFASGMLLLLLAGGIRRRVQLQA